LLNLYIYELLQRYSEIYFRCTHVCVLQWSEILNSDGKHKYSTNIKKRTITSHLNLSRIAKIDEGHLCLRQENLGICYEKFKQWWSSIPPISTKRTITSHLNSVPKKVTKCYVGYAGSELGQAQKCGGVKLVNRTPSLSFCCCILSNIQIIYVFVNLLDTPRSC
jgi:hypothetical protein